MRKGPGIDLSKGKLGAAIKKIDDDLIQSRDERTVYQVVPKHPDLPPQSTDRTPPDLKNIRQAETREVFQVIPRHPYDRRTFINNPRINLKPIEEDPTVSPPYPYRPRSSGRDLQTSPIDLDRDITYDKRDPFVAPMRRRRWFL